MIEKHLIEIGKRLKETRKAIKLTQKEMADASGTSDSVVSEGESGKRKPPSSVLFYLNREHKVNINFILTGSGGMFEEGLDLDGFDPKEKRNVKEMVSLMNRNEYIYHEMIARFLKLKRTEA